MFVVEVGAVWSTILAIAEPSWFAWLVVFWLSLTNDLRQPLPRPSSRTRTRPVIETSSFTVDLAAKKVTKYGSEVHLTPTECGIREMLVRNRGKLVGREELLNEVWGTAYAKETHYLRVYLAELRRKLEDDRRIRCI